MPRNKRPIRRVYRGPVDPTIAAIEKHDAEMKRIFKSLGIQPPPYTHGGYKCPDQETMTRLAAAVDESKIVGGKGDTTYNKLWSPTHRYYVRTWLR